MREELERMIVELDLDQAARELQQAIQHHERQLTTLRAQLDFIVSLRSQAEANARENPADTPDPAGEPAPDAPASE
jgi:hypothetical protein